MGVRTWTARAIREGNSFVWFVGLAIKATAEILAAVAFGWITTKLILWQFPVGAIRNHVGTSTFSAVWLMTAAGFFWKFTLCRFTEALTTN